MAESLKCRRAIFPRGKQKEFVLSAKNKLALTWIEFAGIIGFSVRNLTDWKNEKISMPLPTVKLICEKARVKFPKNIEIRNPYWYVNKGAKKGGLAVYKKYGTIGNPEFRKKKWREWWETEGKLKADSITKPLSFKKPRFSCKLAEFVGIVLGDGGITDYQVKITLHCIDDLEYSLFVENLLFKLFDVKAGKHLRMDCSVFNIELSRIGLVKFCVESLGLKKGNKIKQQIDIPDWVKKKKEYNVACLRGLIDTDGCVIIHRYKSRGKGYIYKKLSFTSKSIPLLKSVSSIMNDLGIKNRLTNHSEIRVEAIKDVERYFGLVGTHNPKHWKRYNK